MKAYSCTINDVNYSPVTADELNYLFSKGIIESSTPIRELDTDITLPYSALLINNYRLASKEESAKKPVVHRQPGLLNFLQIVYTLLYIASIFCIFFLFGKGLDRLASLPVLLGVLPSAIMVHIKYTELRYLFEIKILLEDDEN